MRAKLFNITEISRDNLYPLELEFYAGDITTISSDILVTSSFKGRYSPTPNSVLGALNEKFGISIFSDMLIPLQSDMENICKIEQTIPRDFFKEIWLIHMTQYHTDFVNTDQVINSTFKNLRNCYKTINNSSISSISLPLIGTNYQKLSKQDIVLKLMNLIKEWSELCPKLKSIRLFSYNLDDAVLINKYIDQFFGVYTDNDASQLLFTATVEELKDKICLYENDFNAYMLDLYTIASAKNPSLKSLAIAGRKIAEFCVNLLVDIYEPTKQTNKNTLDKNINIISSHLDCSWFYSYFKLLQLSGNHAAHSFPLQLNLTDSSAIIISSMKLIEYTNKLKKI